MLQAPLEELAGLKAVWTELSPVWASMDKIKSRAWAQVSIYCHRHVFLAETRTTGLGTPEAINVLAFPPKFLK